MPKRIVSEQSHGCMATDAGNEIYESIDQRLLASGGDANGSGTYEVMNLPQGATPRISENMYDTSERRTLTGSTGKYSTNPLYGSTS